MKKILIEKRTGRVIHETKLKNNARRKLLLMLVIVLTVVLSSLPDLHLERMMGLEYSWGFDLLQHGGYYFLFTLYLFHLLPSETPSLSFFIPIFFFSVILEFIQLMIPGRTVSVLDITNNFLGISAAFTVKLVQKALKEN